jgi:hypothetical protein
LTLYAAAETRRIFVEFRPTPAPTWRSYSTVSQCLGLVRNRHPARCKSFALAQAKVLWGPFALSPSHVFPRTPPPAAHCPSRSVSTGSAFPDPRSSRRLPPLDHGSFARPRTRASAALHTRQQSCVPCDRPHTGPTLPRSRLLYTVPLTGALVGKLRILHLSSAAWLCIPRSRLLASPCSEMP